MEIETKIIKHGNHVINNDTDGYMYNFNTSKNYDFNSHIHKCYEFIHILHGHLLYTVEGSEYILSDGDFIMTTPSELHAFSFPKECIYQREFLHIYPGFLKGYPELINSLDSRRPGYFNRFPAETVEKYGIDKIFRGIEECCVSAEPETDFLVLTYSLQLITKISQVLRKESPEHQEIITNKKANAVCDYIDRHYNETISVGTIANALFVSPAYLSRVFKRETGITIKTYLNMRRVTHAKNLIIQGQPVTNAFLECGFDDYSTFYRAFTKYVGMSPEQFKKGQVSDPRQTARRGGADQSTPL